MIIAAGLSEKGSLSLPRSAVQRPFSGAPDSSYSKNNSVRSTDNKLYAAPLVNTARPTPAPKPRQPKKLHDYVNYPAGMGNGAQVNSVPKKPLSFMQSPTSIKPNFDSTIPEDASSRPYTVCAPSSHRPASLNIHPNVQRHASAPQHSPVHYAVSNVFSTTDSQTTDNISSTTVSSLPDMGPSRSVTKRSRSKKTSPTYINVALKPTTEKPTNDSRPDSHAEDSGDYDNNTGGWTPQSPEHDYVNHTFPQSHPQQFSNPCSSDDAIVVRQHSHFSSQESDSEDDQSTPGNV